MNAANLSRSERLQRVRDLLSGGRTYSTLQIGIYARVCAVNSIVSELRANGLEIDCERRGDRWYYTMKVGRKAA